MYDLVVRGGTIVTAGEQSLADVGVAGGVVVQVGGRMQGRREVAATGRYLLPGGVDVHVHLSTPSEGETDRPTWVDDFRSGSEAAIAGGVTTIGNMTFQEPGESLHTALERDLNRAQSQALVDYLLHPVLTDPRPEVLEEIGPLAASGFSSLKIFMVIPDFDQRQADYVKAIAIAGSAGSLTLLHCEDAISIQCACDRLIASGHGGLSHFPESRPIYSESVAVERAIAISRATNSPIYLVHLSSKAALDACRRARSSGVSVYVETRPTYLHLTEDRFEEADAGKYVSAPPLRTSQDRQALWAGLQAADVQTCCSDHAPWSYAAKTDPSLTVVDARQGVADLETLMPMLFSEGVIAGRLTLSRFVELTATNAAKLFGLYPRKGTIAVGSDADLVVWDPEATRTVDGSKMRSRAGYSVYDGWEVTGWPVVTISRGDVLLENGDIRGAPGRGCWLKCGPTRPL